MLTRQTRRMRQWLAVGFSLGVVLCLGVALGLNFLAIQCSLNALDSLIGLVRVSSRGGRVLSDAQSMADLTHMPASVWAALWSGIALAILIGSLYLIVRGSAPAPGESWQID